MKQFHPLRKGGIDKHVAIVSVFTNTSNLKEMKFPTFGIGKRAKFRPIPNHSSFMIKEGTRRHQKERTTANTVNATRAPEIRLPRDNLKDFQSKKKEMNAKSSEIITNS